MKKKKEEKKELTPVKEKDKNVEQTPNSKRNLSNILFPALTNGSKWKNSASPKVRKFARELGADVV